MIFNNTIIFRLVVLFATLLILPFPLTILRSLSLTTDFPPDIYENIIPWFADTFFNLDGPVSNEFNGSGDRRYDYLLLLFKLILALIGTAFWLILDRNEGNYEKLNYWFLVLVRVYVGYMMINYGFAKIIKSQFPDPSYTRLLQPIGSASPMGLAWTFFGHSAGYNLFMGLAEAVGGMLLFYRKTTILGALILVPVVVNIVAINFFYDVPVKLFSSQLLFFCFLILLPKINILLKTVFANPYKTFLLEKFHLVKDICKGLFLICIIYFLVQKASKSKERRSPKSPIPNTHHLYKINSYFLDQDTIPYSVPDSNRWDYIALDRSNYLIAVNKDRSRKWFKVEVDTIQQTLSLEESRKPNNRFDLNYTNTDSTLTLTGFYKNDSISLVAKVVDKSSFLLEKTKFKWINEFPFNR